MVRNKILKKLKEGSHYVNINPFKDSLFCPICKEVMSSEGNAFKESWFCNNQKCKVYLKRHGIKGKGFFGNVEFHKDEIVKYFKDKTQPKKEREG